MELDWRPEGSTVFPATIFTELKIPQQLSMKICYTEFYPNPTDRATSTRRLSSPWGRIRYASHYADFQGPRAYV